MTYDTGSNVVPTDTNPAYTAGDFLEDYPQFTDGVPEAMITRFCAMASATVAVDRWFDNWAYGMGLYVAHRCTLYLQTTAADTATAEEAAATGQAAGAITNLKSGDASVTFDHGDQTKGTEDWGMYNATAFGRLFATEARLLGAGGSYVI